MKHFAHVFAVVFASLYLIGCGPKFVSRPDADSVRTIAIVSVHSNIGLHDVTSDSEGAGNGFSVSEALSAANAIGKAAGGKSGVYDFGGTRLVEHANLIAQNEFASVKNWTVVPTSQVLANPAYTEYRRAKEDELKNLGAVGRIAEAGWVVAPGMAFVSLNMEDSGRANVAGDRQKLGQLAAALGVDAVAVIQLANGYDVNDTFGGQSGNAWANVGIDVKMVNKAGNFVVNTPDVGPTKGARFKSKESISMIAGVIPFNEKTESMYRTAISNGLSAIREQVGKELAD